jgi:NADH pyrophosphatase NudC (nudix superfamily)
MSLIGGLNDKDTKQAVLSKVDELLLDETITFVEARETGKTALKILGRKLSSGQVKKVQQEREDQRSCTYCGQKGHGKSPSNDLRKADCPAFGKKCAQCARKDTMQGFVR